MKVLILSLFKEHDADGPANVLKDYMEGHTVNCIVNIEDVFKHAGSMIGDLIVRRLSNLSITDLINGKRLGMTHINGYTMDDTGIILEDIILGKLRNLIEEYAPDVLVCTHPYYLKLVYKLKQNLLHNISVLALITSFSLDDSWAYNYVDAYVVANEEMKLGLIKLGVNTDRIFSYGIPVSPRYFLKFDKRLLLDTLGFKDKPTILMTAMSPCMASHRKILKSILDSSEDFQIIIAAGSSERFKNQAVHISQGCKKGIRIFGNTDMLPEIMALSSIMISYLSSQVICQAMASGLPFAFLTPSSSLKKQNADFYFKKDLGVEISKDIIGIEKAIALLENDTRLKEMRSRIETLVKPYAVSQIANLITNLSGITSVVEQR